MVAGLEIALILRSRAGVNVLIQTRSVDVKAASDAAWEVGELLAGYYATKGAPDPAGSGDNPPGFVNGAAAAGGGRYKVVYRLLNSLYVMAVAPQHTNVFFATQLVNAVSRLLYQLARTYSITADSVTRRFAEVYLATGILLDSGDGNFRRAALEADEKLAAISNDGAAKAAVRQVRKVLTLRKGSNSISKAGQASATNIPALFTDRKLADEVDPLSRISFKMPDDALPPLKFVPQTGSAYGAAPRGYDAIGMAANFFAGQSEYDPFSGTPASRGGPASPGDNLLDMSAAATPPDGQGLTPVDPGAPSWAPFDGGASPLGGTISPAKNLAYPEPTGPKGLWLVEVWRAHFDGGKLARAGTLGQVMGRHPVTPALLHTTFRLGVPEGAGAPLAAAVRAGGLDRDLASRAPEPSSFIAYFDRTGPHKHPAFLKYKLPAVAIPPPIVVRVAARLLEAETEGGVQNLTLVVQWAVMPRLTVDLQNVMVDLDVHPQLGEPVKVSPGADWCPGQQRLQWRLRGVASGQRGAFRVAFQPSTANDALAAAGIYGGATAKVVEETRVRLRFNGPQKSTLSGVTLEAGPPEELEPCNCWFHGEVTASINVIVGA